MKFSKERKKKHIHFIKYSPFATISHTRIAPKEQHTYVPDLLLNNSFHISQAILIPFFLFYSTAFQWITPISAITDIQIWDKRLGMGRRNKEAKVYLHNIHGKVMCKVKEEALVNIFEGILYIGSIWKMPQPYKYFPMEDRKRDGKVIPMWKSALAKSFWFFLRYS